MKEKVPLSAYGHAKPTFKSPRTLQSLAESRGCPLERQLCGGQFSVGYFRNGHVPVFQGSRLSGPPVINQLTAGNRSFADARSV